MIIGNNDNTTNTQTRDKQVVYIPVGDQTQDLRDDDDVKTGVQTTRHQSRHDRGCWDL